MRISRKFVLATYYDLSYENSILLFTNFTGKTSVEEKSKKQSAASNLTLEQKEKIGNKCKRIIDLARIKYLEENGFECFLKYYVHTDTTPENVCLIARTRRNSSTTN